MPRRESWLTLVLRSFWIWFGAIWLLVGVLFLVVSVWGIGSEQELEHSGVVTEGEVLDKWRESGAVSPHKVRYRFAAPDGRAYADEAALPRRQWEGLRAGDAVRVRYHPSRPWSHQLEQEEDLGPLPFVALGLVVTGVGGWLIGMWSVKIRRFLRLQEHGMLVEGTVLEVSPTGIIVNDERLHVVRYEYRDHQAQMRQGASRPMAPEEALRWTPGERGSVRYDRTRPSISEWMGARWGE